MKRLYLFILLFLSLPLSGINGFIGPYLCNLKMNNLFPIKGNPNEKIVNIKFPGQRIYQIKVLQQPSNTATCGRHVIKNAIFTINAFIKAKRIALKNSLRKLYNLQAFNFLNKTICLYTGIANNQISPTSFMQIQKALKGIQNNDFQKKYKLASKVLPNNTKNIVAQILCKWIGHSNASRKMIQNGQYKNNQQILKIINNTFPNKQILNSILNFKKSNRKTLGLILFIPGANPSAVGHVINLVVHKVGNTFEYFVLDSANLNQPYWLRNVQFLKFLFNLPINRLQHLSNMAKH